jgi:hypothetical protein
MDNVAAAGADDVGEHRPKFVFEPDSNILTNSLPHPPRFVVPTNCELVPGQLRYVASTHQDGPPETEQDGVMCPGCNLHYTRHKGKYTQ